MYKLPLKSGEIALVDEDIVTYLTKIAKWHYNRKHGYAMGYNRITKKKCYLHRIVMDAKEGQFVDHINQDKLDNRKSNLRFVSRSENHHNKPSSRPNKSGYRGVYSFSRNNIWAAFINYEGKRIYIGRSYLSKEEAALAYNQKASELFGEYAYQNIIV